jgi:hypothetical protein
MARLDAAARKRLPAKDFAGPGRSYPIEDKAHARNAKARASQAEHEGRISEAEKARIDAKADRKLGEKGMKAVESKKEVRAKERRGEEHAVEKRAERKVERRMEEHHVHHHVHHEAHMHHHGGEKPMERKEHMRKEARRVRDV